LPAFLLHRESPGKDEPLQLAANFGFDAAQLRQLMRGDRLQPAVSAWALVFSATSRRLASSFDSAD